MKKSKLLVSLLASAMVVGMSACQKDPLENEDQDIVAVYNAYKANAEAKDETPLSYDEWLKTVKGEKGDKGDKGDNGNNGADGVTPRIGENGNWFIGTTDTGIKAQGAKGDKGDNGNDGLTPEVKIGENGNWFINNVDSGIKAQGAKGDKGDPGNPGATPTIEISIDKTWIINGVDTGIKAQGQNGNPGDKGDKGDDGNPGADGQSIYDLFKEDHPHYTGTKQDYMRDMMTGYFEDHMPKAGHTGLWSYNATAGAIERTCSECGAVESIAANLPNSIVAPVTPNGLEGVYSVSNSADYPWIYDAANSTWKSGNKGIKSSTSTVTFTPNAAGLKFNLHVSVSSEGGSYDYFSVSSMTGISNSLGGTNLGGQTTVERDIEFVSLDSFISGNNFSLSYRKDSSGDKGEDQATVTNFVVEAPISALDPEKVPGAVVVNFVKNNFEGDEQVVAYAGVDVNLPTPVRYGYAFDGWYLDEAFTTPAPSSFTSSANVYAKWAKMHKVTVVDYVNGGDDVVYTVKNGDTLEMAMPESDTELFSGLYVAPGCTPGTEFDMTKPIKRDTVVYCKWSPAPAYAGTYGGTNMFNAHFGDTNGRELTIKPNGKLEGVYDGVATPETENVLSISNSNDKLYIFDDFIIGANGIDSDSDIYILIKNAAPASATNKYIFNTAFQGAKGSQVNRIFSITLDGVTTNYALIDGVIYKNVRYSSLDGDFEIGVGFGTGASDYKKDLVIVSSGGALLATIANGKYADADYGHYMCGESRLKVYGDGKSASIDGVPCEYTKVGDNLKVVEYSSRKTVTSYSASSSSTMTWDETKGVWVYKQYSYSSGTDTVYNDPTIVWKKENSKFVFGEDVIAGDAIYTLDKSNGTFTVDRPEFTITMHNGAEDSVTTRRVGTTFELPTPNINDNQAFLGWFTAADFSGNPVTSVTANAEVYAKVVTTYKLTVHKNLEDGETPEVITFNAGDMMNPPELVKDGFVFKGWFTDEDFATAYVPAAAAADAEIYAKWVAGKYTNNAANYLDAIDPDGNFIASINFNTDLPWTAKVKDGHDCMCANDAQNTTASIIEITVKVDCWFDFDYISSSEASYDYLKIYVDGTKVSDTKGSGTNETEGSGHRHIFVPAGKVLKLAYEKDSMFKLDNTIYLYNVVFAVPEKVNVTLNTGVGTPTVVEATKGATYTPVDPTRDGFAFMGWFTDELFATPYDDTVELTGDITLYAKWYDLSSAVGTTKADAVSCKAGDYDDAADLTTITICPGQTEIWFKVEITETNKSGGTGSSPYFYMITDNNTAFKSKFVRQDSYMNDETEAAASQTSIYGSSYLYTGSIGTAGILATEGATVYVKLTVKDITEPTTLKVVFHG